MITAETYFYEIPNVLLLLFYTVCLLSYTQQRKIIFRIFLAHMLLIFFTNGILFDPGYMPDQVRYVEAVKSLRNDFKFTYDEYNVLGMGFTKESASIIFSIVPLMCNSIFSVAGMNYFFYMLIFLFMYKKNMLNDHGLYFFLFYPSLALYAAVGVRDTAILFFMMLSIYHLLNDEYVVAIVYASFLFVLKMQNFLIFILSVLLWMVMDRKFNFKKVVFIALSIVVLGALSSNLSIDKLNFYRIAFALEDGVDPLDIEMITGTVDLIVRGFLGIFRFLLIPLPWDVRNVLQFIQSAENIGILILLFFAVRSYIKLGIRDKVIRFLFAHTLIAFAIYGFVIANYGTAARYRYPYITVFFLFFYYRMHQLQSQQIFKLR